MKSFTDLEQSKKLAEILPIESADMHYCFNFDLAMNNWWRTIPNVTKKDNHFELYPNDIPCWSLAALLSVFSTPKLELDEQEDGERGWFVSHYTDDYRYDSYYRDEPIDACYNLILQLKEKNLL